MNTCVHIPNCGLRCVTWNTTGLIGSPVSPQSSRERRYNYFTRRTQNNEIVCLQEIYGKDEIFQAIQILAPRFWLYGTFIPNNVNAGGSAICIHKDLLSDEARVTHVVTCQSRDHIVSIRSGGRNLVVVNVHFESDLTLRSLRERLRLITPYWPLYPEAVGVITGTSIFASQRKEGSMFGIRPSPREIREKLPCSIPSFLVSSKSLSPTLQGETPKPMARYTHCPGLIEHSSTSLWLKLATSTAILTYLRILENGLFRVTMQMYALSCRNRTIRGNLGKRIPSWMSKHPGCCSILKQISDGHQYPDDTFPVWLI